MSQPTGMCLTDGQILAGQVGDAAPFSRINRTFEEFDENSTNDRGTARLKPRVPCGLKKSHTCFMYFFLRRASLVCIVFFVCFHLSIIFHSLSPRIFHSLFDRCLVLVLFEHSLRLRLNVSALLTYAFSYFYYVFKMFEKRCALFLR